MWPPLNGHMDLHSSSGSCCCLPDEIWAHRPSAGADLVYLSFWMGTTLETVTKFRAFGAPPGLILGSCCCLPDKIWAHRPSAAAGNPGNPQGPWKWLPEKERTLQNRQILSSCGVPSISAVPEAGFPGNPQLLCHVKFCHKIKGLEHILGRSRGGPFSKMWPPLNGHMDSHSSSFSGATHKERPGLPRKG